MEQQVEEQVSNCQVKQRQMELEEDLVPVVHLVVVVVQGLPPAKHRVVLQHVQPSTMDFIKQWMTTEVVVVVVVVV